MEELELLRQLQSCHSSSGARVPSTRRRRQRIRFFKKDPFLYASEREFRRHFRMTKASFSRLLDLVTDDLSPANARGLPTPAHIKLLVALRYYAVGSFHYITGKVHGCSPAHVCQVVKQVSRVLARLLPSFLKMPTAAQAIEVSETDATLPCMTHDAGDRTTTPSRQSLASLTSGVSSTAHT